MEKKLQLELYQKLKELIQNHVGRNFRFERQENGKTVFLLIENRDSTYLGKVPVYLETLGVKEYPKERIKHNHGGTEGTVLVSISKITEASIKKIEEAYHLMKELKRNKNKSAKNKHAFKKTEEVVHAPVMKEETSNNVTPEVKPQNKKRDSSYGLRRYLSRVLDFEGYSFKKDVEIKPIEGYYNFCTDKEEVSNLILHATAWYCHNTNAVTILNEQGKFCIVVDLEIKKPAPKGWEKFDFCSPPKKEESGQRVRDRIKRIIGHDDFSLTEENLGTFKFLYSDKSEKSYSRFLVVLKTLKTMLWDVRMSLDCAMIHVGKESVEKNEEIIASGKSKEDLIVKKEKEIEREMRWLFKDKEDAFAQLESFILSQEFKTLTPELQTELKNLWRNLWIKSLKEDSERFARLLLDYLKQE